MAARAISPSLRSWTKINSCLDAILMNEQISAEITTAVVHKKREQLATLAQQKRNVLETASISHKCGMSRLTVMLCMQDPRIASALRTSRLAM